MARRTSHSVSFEEYGRTVLGAPLQWMPPKSGNLDFLIIAGIHGEEPDTTVVLSRALRSLPRDSVHDDMGIILCANPDGLALGTRGNARGVDLNRNFASENWQKDPVFCRWHVEDTEKIPIDTGSHAASEPETSGIQHLVLERERSPRRILSLHGPLDCIDDPDCSPFGQWLAEKTGANLVPEIGYPTPGSMGSWAEERSISLVTWEFPNRGIEALSQQFVPILHDCMSRGPDKLEPCRSDSD